MEVDEFGRSPLHYVSAKSPLDLQESETERLIQDGCDPDLQDKNGWTALHFAAQECSLAAARALLAAGAATDVPNSHGNTPLWVAVFNSKGDGEIIRLLLDSGADPERENNHGISPFALAESIAYYDVRKFYN